MQKCGKKDCVDFDVEVENFELEGNCGICGKSRLNPNFPNDLSEYQPVPEIVNPTDYTIAHDPKASMTPAGIHQSELDMDNSKMMSVKEIKDSGGRTEFDTGAVRDAQGDKGRFDLLPKMTIWALAKHYEKGCQKYGDRNWEKGIPIQNYIDSGSRHLTEFELGLQDENHLIAALWNIACAYETLLRIDMGILPRSLDTLPYPLRGVVKDSEQVLAWERMRHPLHEAA